MGEVDLFVEEVLKVNGKNRAMLKNYHHLKNPVNPQIKKPPSRTATVLKRATVHSVALTKRRLGSLLHPRFGDAPIFTTTNGVRQQKKRATSTSPPSIQESHVPPGTT
jgi:hypothetical protein